MKSILERVCIHSERHDISLSFMSINIDYISSTWSEMSSRQGKSCRLCKILIQSCTIPARRTWHPLDACGSPHTRWLSILYIRLFIVEAIYVMVDGICISSFQIILECFGVRCLVRTSNRLSKFSRSSLFLVVPS